MIIYFRIIRECTAIHQGIVKWDKIEKGEKYERKSNNST